ncbi:MAG: BlaI/MecI/CopY family transcriptional regulator [archaeon]|nr:BlaI/MecI/CopY family transcriptional regulator [archaeon]MCP8321439.1 BlaI/MecI/CopY family transcriptional regulator [archaeon]
MNKRRIKIEFDDEEGGKYRISMEGSLSRDKVLKVVDMVEMIGGKSEVNQQTAFSRDTTFGHLYTLIEKKFTFGSFTSTDILEAYEDEYNSPIRLSTISTYLQRLTEKGLLTRNKTNSGWAYRRAQLNLQR